MAVFDFDQKANILLIINICMKIGWIVFIYEVNSLCVFYPSVSVMLNCRQHENFFIALVVAEYISVKQSHLPFKKDLFFIGSQFLIFLGFLSFHIL